MKPYDTIEPAHRILGSERFFNYRRKVQEETLFACFDAYTDDEITSDEFERESNLITAKHVQLEKEVEFYLKQCDWIDCVGDYRPARPRRNKI